MPLAFESLSHGTIAFGFFNIESDMLLLELVKYVWRGGYPRWKNELRSDYVLAMKDKIEGHRQGLFEKIQFD